MAQPVKQAQLATLDKLDLKDRWATLDKLDKPDKLGLEAQPVQLVIRVL
jgi:hypothetical protein